MSATAEGPDLRARLMGEIKTAMKNKDTATSTTLRSLMSEVYNADKASSAGKVDSAAIGMILRKAVERRSEAVSTFKAAARDDLAEKELQEIQTISKFLPPLLTESEIDGILSSVIRTVQPTSPPQKALGLIFKEFYSQVDKSRVDSDLLKKRAQALLSSGA